MASKPGMLSKFPWEDMGNFKYTLFLPFAIVAATGRDDADNWCWHMCGLAVARYALAQCFVTASRVHAISGKHRIQKRGIGFEQMDREENWDDFILLQAIVMTLVHWVLPGFHSFPKMDANGLLTCLLLHAGPTEFVYYWFHRALHHHSMYSQYHSHHHKSFVTEPVSGSCHPFLEHLGYTANFAIPMLGTWLLGGCSVAMFYFYTCGFDVLNMVGHCNWEFVPVKAYRAIPWLKYLIYTPSYHSLHHSRVHTNFCLFMPVYDYMFGTLELDKDGSGRWTSDRLQEASLAKTAEDATPECVFLAHGTDLLSVFHLPMFLRGFAKDPYRCHWALWPLWPLAAAGAAVLWKFGTVFVSHDERCGGKQVQTWVVPRFGFQYFLGRSEEQRINNLIERAIRDADAAGVKVLGLGALNKAEHLNGGGVIFPEILGPDLGTRVVHGNTLTAACLLAELDLDGGGGGGGGGLGRREVFVTGATSKLGRAVALYLCRKGVRVVMLTSSEERFATIQREAAPEHAHLLVRASSHAEGARIATWVVAKQCGAADQACAPPGCHFHQVVVPPITPHRTDCTYGELAAMVLPPSSADTKACELFMPRRTVFACHAGALTHCLSGWTHHEVGAIDVGAIDATMGAALGLGFLPCTKGWPEASKRAFQARVDQAQQLKAAAVQAANAGAPGALARSASDEALTSDEAASDESSHDEGDAAEEKIALKRRLAPASKHFGESGGGVAALPANISAAAKGFDASFEVVAGTKDSLGNVTPPPLGVKRDLSPTAARKAVDVEGKRQK